MNDRETTAHIEAMMKDVYSLFRAQKDYEDVSVAEHRLIECIQYASAVVQAEKVMPPGGWDPYGR